MRGGAGRGGGRFGFGAGDETGWDGVTVSITSLYDLVCNTYLLHKHACCLHRTLMLLSGRAGGL